MSERSTRKGGLYTKTGLTQNYTMYVHVSQYLDVEAWISSPTLCPGGTGVIPYSCPFLTLVVSFICELAGFGLESSRVRAEKQSVSVRGVNCFRKSLYYP